MIKEHKGKIDMGGYCFMNTQLQLEISQNKAQDCKKLTKENFKILENLESIDF